MTKKLTMTLTALFLAILILPNNSFAGPQMRDDGIHTESWMKSMTFLDLKEDLAEAKKKGKGLVILYEAPGCGSCKKLHEVNFQKSDLVKFITKNFDVMQINIFGDNEVTNFDGKVLSEKKLAQKLGIHFTPTTVFYGKKGEELFRMPGYLSPRFYKKGFDYVLAGGPQKKVLFPHWIRDQKMKKKKSNKGS
ncbi:MAG: thioredoxin family protein [Rhodospirillales bacterium]